MLLARLGIRVRSQYFVGLEAIMRSELHFGTLYIYKLCFF